jgi:DNA polymerase-3 subunit delta'
VLSFDDIYGNKRIKERLVRTVRTDSALNAYVFEGADGIGKKTTADIFAASLLCEEGGLPCGKCGACIKCDTKNHPDIIYVKKKKDKATIGIEDVREQVMETVYVKPFLSDKKIFIIAEGGALTQEAQNGLLKVLEEPPSYAVFIILVPKASMLLDTVLSRSVLFTFLPLSEDEAYRYFKENTDYGEEQLKFAASFSQGVIGRGLLLLEDESFSELYAATTKHMLRLMSSGDGVQEFERFLIENKAQIDFVIDFMLILIRDCILVCLGTKQKILCRDKLNEIEKIAAGASKKALVSAADSIISYRKRMMQNANTSAMALELLLNIREEVNDKGNRSQV